MLVVVVAVWQLRDPTPDGFVGRVHLDLHTLCNGFRPVLVAQVPQGHFCDAGRVEHGQRIALALLAESHVGKEHVPESLIDDASIHQLHRDDAHALLIDLSVLAREAARRSPAYVCVVGPDADIQEYAAIDEERSVEGYVVEMRAAGVGIVDGEHVTGVNVVSELVLRGVQPECHCEDVAREVLGHGGKLAPGGKQSAGEVAAFVQNRCIGRPDERHPHLQHGRDEPASHYLQRYRVYVSHATDLPYPGHGPHLRGCASGHCYQE